MSSPGSDRSTRYARIGTEEAQPDSEGRPTSDIAERHVGNEPSGSNDSVVDGRSQISLPASPVSPLSEHSDHISRPTSFEKKSRTSSAALDVKESEIADVKQPEWWSRLVEDSWTVELVAGFVSFAAIASIIGVLWAYDQKPVPPLTFGITVSLILFICSMAMSS